MTRLYLDHDVSAQTALALRQEGHDVVSTREVQQERARDYRQLLRASSERRVLVSHNEKDYCLLHGAWLVWSVAWAANPQHSGILIIPQWSPTFTEWDPVGASQQLIRFLESHSSCTNELHIFRRHIGWRLFEP